VKHEAGAIVQAPDIYDEEDDFDDAIELSAERAAELARGLTEVARDFPHIACPKRLVLIRLPYGILVQTELASWIVRQETSEHVEFLNAMIRPELLDVWTAGSC